MAQQKTRIQRREALISATRKVARESGLAGTSVRAVAAEAAVSVGSVLYYFPNFDELMFATVEGVMEEFYERRRAISDAHTDPRARLAALIVAGVPDEISSDLRMAYESIPLLRQQPQYKPLHRSVVERQVMLYRSAIEIGVALGDFHPTTGIDVIARNIVALEDAYDMYPLIGFDLPAAGYRRNIASYVQTALACELPPLEALEQPAGGAAG
ncbi:TetR/AcrR family transcriptional regulator [Specibacter cremeus]|uniref:TetR/AcrR family transcriptional regulator n=1 Tax=Specibacter cremeus TaxID=1629051 RepID=UPI0013DE2E04|nr:TetR family transcriptional regulator [Specibacter cremeus]